MTSKVLLSLIESTATCGEECDGISRAFKLVREDEVSKLSSCDGHSSSVAPQWGQVETGSTNSFLFYEKMKQIRLHCIKVCIHLYVLICMLNWQWNWFLQ